MSVINKAVLLDRDGTINIDKDYLYQLEEFEFIPGAKEALRIFQDMGYLIIIVTNQSGIAKGYYNEQMLEELHHWMREELLKQEIRITDILYCPHHPNAIIEKYKAECVCRKPRLGMYKKAIKQWNLDIKECYVIGDRLRDLELCKEYDCSGILVGNREEEIAKLTTLKSNKIAICNDLYDAAQLIVKKEGVQICQL